MLGKTRKGNTEMCHMSDMKQEGLDRHMSYMICHNAYKGKHFSLSSWL